MCCLMPLQDGLQRLEQTRFLLFLASLVSCLFPLPAVYPLLGKPPWKTRLGRRISVHAPGPMHPTPCNLCAYLWPRLVRGHLLQELKTVDMRGAALLYATRGGTWHILSFAVLFVCSMHQRLYGAARRMRREIVAPTAMDSAPRRIRRRGRPAPLGTKQISKCKQPGSLQANN